MIINYKYNIFDHPLISERYFFPRYVSFNNPYLIKSQGNILACYYKKEENATHTIVHFHGNSEVSADYIHSPLNSLPCNILYVEYAGFGASSKVRPKLLSMLKDIDAIIATLNLPVDKLIFFGRSIGSIYAINAAACYPNAAGLIIESGIGDIVEQELFCISPDELNVPWYAMMHYKNLYFNHPSKLQYFQGKTLILHAQHDSIVNIDNARLLYSWAQKPKSLHIFKRGDHNNILEVNKKEYLAIVSKFIRDLY